MVAAGLAATGFDEVGLLSLSSADHSEINEIAIDLADCYEGTNVGLSLPSTRVDAFNVTLADELSRGGRRSGLTFAPEGGSDRIRKVINKMVTEDDLIKTVTTAYASGWRQVKLYFMCGLPTETDEDVIAIAGLARRVIEAGREATGRRDIRCTVSIGGFVPKPHTPFQWAPQCDHETVDARLRALARALRADRAYGKSIGYRYHDGKPSIVEGLLSRGDRRVAKVIRAAWADGARFDGWSEHFSYDRWERCAAEALADEGVDLAWYTTRERDDAEVLPWDHLDAGLDRDWLWQDWLASIDPSSGAMRTRFAGRDSTVQEAIFVPPPGFDTGDGEGYVMQLVDRHAAGTTDLLILDAQRIDAEPVATLRIPIRMPGGLHGNWVTEEQLAQRAG